MPFTFYQDCGCKIAEEFRYFCQQFQLNGKSCPIGTWMDMRNTAESFAWSEQKMRQIFLIATLLPGGSFSSSIPVKWEKRSVPRL